MSMSMDRAHRQPIHQLNSDFLQYRQTATGHAWPWPNGNTQMFPGITYWLYKCLLLVVSCRYCWHANPWTAKPLLNVRPNLTMVCLVIITAWTMLPPCRARLWQPPLTVANSMAMAFETPNPFHPGRSCSCLRGHWHRVLTLQGSHRLKGWCISM